MFLCLPTCGIVSGRCAPRSPPDHGGALLVFNPDVAIVPAGFPGVAVSRYRRRSSELMWVEDRLVERCHIAGRPLKWCSSPVSVLAGLGYSMWRMVMIRVVVWGVAVVLWG